MANGDQQAQAAVQVRLLTWGVGLICTIMVAEIPWAFSMHGRLSSIETHIKTLEVPPEWFKSQVDDLERKVHELELDVAGMKRGG